VKLLKRKCKAYSNKTSKLSDEEIITFLKEVSSWRVIAQNGILKLFKEYHFQNYEEGIYFVNKVASISETNEHHPILLVKFNSVEVWWWSSEITGLHENDFIMASKSDEIVHAFA